MKNLLSKCLLCLALMMMPIVSWADEEYNPDRGFRPPGGLHTEADFARIRQQLSEGNEKVVAAYNKLKSAAYAQSSAATYPVETIVRGGGVGENYINAGRIKCGSIIRYFDLVERRCLVGGIPLGEQRIYALALTSRKSSQCHSSNQNLFFHSCFFVFLFV